LLIPHLISLVGENNSNNCAKSNPSSVVDQWAMATCSCQGKLIISCLNYLHWHAGVLESCEPAGKAEDGVVDPLRLAAAPHATARARLHAGYSARAIARSAARYRALHRAGLFSLPSAAARARSPPYHCSCGPAFN
jgi:hypothetical protein